MGNVRMSRANRRTQLLEVALGIVRDEGADSLTLGRLAERAGVTKPVTYGHFETRDGLLMALYAHLDDQLISGTLAAVAAAPPLLDRVLRVFSAAYIDCVARAGPQFAAISDALSGGDVMQAFRLQRRDTYLTHYRAALAPYVRMSDPQFHCLLVAFQGAADALATDAAAGRIARDDAADTLFNLLTIALTHTGA